MDEKKFSDAMSEIDSKYVNEAISYNSKVNKVTSVPRFRRLPVALIVAISALFLIGVGAVAAGVFGTQLIEFFTSRTEPGTDYSQSGFDLNVEIEKIPISDFTGEVHEVGAIIKRQFEDYKPYDSWHPGHWQANFSSYEGVCDYIGFSLLKQLDWDLKEQTTILNVYGNEKGQILSFSLEIDYIVNNIHLQFFSQIYTENYTEEIIIKTRTTENIEFTESFYTTDNHKQCHIINSTAMDSGYICMDGYLIDNGVLYSLTITYQNKDSLQATELMHQWANLF